MENKDNIEIIKEILYEESTRKMLSGQQDDLVSSGSNEPSIAIWKWLVAAAVIGIVSLIGFNLFDDDTQDKSLMAYSVHDFPVITKSRGMQQNIVDNHLLDINQGDYKTILPLLKKDSISEKDKFVKALILFRLGEHDEAKELIAMTQWTDTYHQSELDWVLFLIAYSSNDSLELFESQLSDEYRLKAKELLDK